LLETAMYKKAALKAAFLLLEYQLITDCVE